MSKKPTRRKTPSKKDSSTGKDQAKSPSTGSADAAPETTGANEEASAKKTTHLPASGFAEDLLGKTRARDGGSGEHGSEEADQARVVETAVRRFGEIGPAADAAVAAGGAESTDPERIFRFADTLDGATTEKEQPTVRRMGTWVSFALAGETFALPVEPVREVVRVGNITRVPHAPKPIRGVTNLRGRVIPIVDLRLRIDLPPTEFERATRIIVVAARGRLIGLLVDAVQQVVHLDLDQIQPPPEDAMTVQSDYISGVYHLDDHLVLLLNVERALIIRGGEELISPSPIP